MMHTCPCCGQTTSEPSLVEVAMGDLTPLRQSLVRRLARNMGAYVATPCLVHAVWGDDPNGGPDKPSVNVSILVRNTNATLARHGLVIRSKQGRGYMLRRAA